MTEKRVVIYTDGACKGNPGPMGIGVVIKDEYGQILKQHSEFLGSGTNNQAEYFALRKALKLAKELKATHVTVFSDSKVMVDHLNGKANVTNYALVPIADEIKRLAKSFQVIHINHTYRNKNKHADFLANKSFEQIKDSLD